MGAITVKTLLVKKERGEKIAAVTAYDFPFAQMADQAGIHVILVGDSVGMVVCGEDTTLPVTMDQMIYHTRIVARAAKNALVIGDMPFMSYQASTKDAIENAGRFLKEAGAAAVKLEGGASVSHIIKAITEAGIPVQAHIGLTPQSVHQMGGYRVQKDEERLIADAKKVQEAGAFSVVLEGIPSMIAKKITQTLSIPTIGIGAGPHCDGQILVLHDLLGLHARRLPKFVKQYASLRQEGIRALEKYVMEVETHKFPDEDHSYS